MTNKERSVEQIILELPTAAEICDEHGNCQPDTVYISDVEKVLQTERRKRYEMVEAIKEVVAHNSYNIDAGGRVSERHDSAEKVCNDIMCDIDEITQPNNPK